jgi:hypothetical protein
MVQIPIKPMNMNYEEPMETLPFDAITPAHYHKGGIDVIAFAEAQYSKEELKGFYRINIQKYVTRYDRKNGIEDLKKGRFYLDKLIELEGQE